MNSRAASARLRSVISSAATLIAHDVSRRPAQRMPIGYPKSLFALGRRAAQRPRRPYGFSGLQNRADNLLDRRCERRHAFPDRAAQMAIDRDAADFSETLIYMHIAAVRRKECEANRGCVVNQLERRLRELQDVCDGGPTISLLRANWHLPPACVASGRAVIPPFSPGCGPQPHMSRPLNCSCSASCGIR